MPVESAISIKEVSKRYGKQHVLKDIHLEIHEAEIFGLLGPSGAGKTTLVKQMTGLEEATSGDIYVLKEKQPSLKLMDRIGYMAQSDALYSDLTARENLHFFAALYGLNKKKQKARVNEVSEIVELEEHLDKLVSNYSGGMKRRLSLAISLVHEPDILILDEPTVGIDPILRKNIWDRFENLKQSGITIVVTTHVMDEAEKCDRLGMIREGKLIALGTPDELKEETESNNLEEAFLAYGGLKNES